ncbi:MAG: FAD-dependent oxidoreductase [Bacteroidales bacterium]|nr:FAD-dependent oxidoreductase [Bacteroidales bacterium]
MSEKINVILNGKNVIGEKGETILNLATRNGIRIPTLCNDPRLKPYTSCFVCVVEVEGMRTLQPSCSTTICEGMRINTDNERVHKSRKTAFELLLSNHYADCKAPCTQACPAGVDIQGYISLIEKGLYDEAVALIKQNNPLPAICGRVCVRPCELACRRNLLDENNGVGIDYLKRFVSDFDLLSGNKFVPEIKPSTNKKIAVIGAGPGGLSAAYFLQTNGHQVDIFEALPHAGGWLRYGIPEYRLPNDILQKEVDNITDLGVKIFFNKKFGKNLSYKELKKNYDAVILTIGSQKGTLVGCKNDDAENVFSGIEFLKNMEITGQRYNFKDKTIAVVGGGNVAMDCCRTAIRCNAKKVYVIYRRTENEMPANKIEIHESKLEGVEYLFLTNPKEVIKDESGKLKSLICLKMRLGEPDASGRRRPIPIEGSEFNLELDYILAAIGQRTQVDFIDDINKNTDKGELKINRRGNIEADPETLQTGVESIFAAGDGVTGPATIIEAIAQAKKASVSCDQFLKGEDVKPLKKEFLSKKDNFKELTPDDFKGKFIHQDREEMPTLPASDRINFKEVELGYSEEQAIHETKRCVECGCSEYETCNLRKYATEYNVDQTKYEGDYNEFQVDFRHPFIEIDNNKCILCARCIRICNEVVGANALGLINRGFKTYVAPSMGNKLQDTNCESCGLCISACPTGAITENVPFKILPVKLDKTTTICNYCSVGCSINIEQKSDFTVRVTGNKGLVNTDSNICRFAKFGYKYLNDNLRILKPLLKVDNKFQEISFDKAYEIIAEKIKAVNPDENIFFAGARLSNEKMYLIQKLARAGVKTNNVGSFHYLDRGDGYANNSFANADFKDLKEASKIYLIGSEINNDNAVVGFMINNTHVINQTPVELITVHNNSSMKHKVNNTILVKSYYHFVKAVIYYILSNNLENKLFIDDNCEGFEEYKNKVLAENYEELIKKSNVDNDTIKKFAEDYNRQINAIIVFSEKENSANTCLEIFNLAMITGKLGKTANGLISLKEKNNSQGLFDMGIFSSRGIGGQKMIDKNYIQKLSKLWNIDDLPENINDDLFDLMADGKIKNIFIFGEDPIGCAVDKEKIKNLISCMDFKVVQDSFLTETAAACNLILPASFSAEETGSFTNAQRKIQTFNQHINEKLQVNSYSQIIEIMKKLGVSTEEDINDVFIEISKLLQESKNLNIFKFNYTFVDNNNHMFDYGCDYLNKRFEEEFDKALEE